MGPLAPPSLALAPSGVAGGRFGLARLRLGLAYVPVPLLPTGQLIVLYAFRHPGIPGLSFSSAAWMALFYACDVPLLAWAPLLGAVTVAYHRRRAHE